METRVYDSFSESKEDSYHGGPRNGSAEPTKSGLSQLLANAAHTLQGGPSSKSTHTAEERTETTEKSPRETLSRSLGKSELSQSLGKQANNALAAWQRFFGHHPSHSAADHEPNLEESTLSGSHDAVHMLHDNQTASPPSSGIGESMQQDPRLGSQQSLARPVLQKRKKDSPGSLQTPGSELKGIPVRKKGQQKGHGTERSFPSSSSTVHPPSGIVRESMNSLASSSGPHDLPMSMTATTRSSMSVATGRNSTDDMKVPTRVYYDSVHAIGQHPPSRWGHACTVWQDRLFIFGGANTSWHSDCFVYHSGRNSWSRVPGVAKSAPPATFGAAACCMKDTIFLFGGKQNQKHCRKLFTLNPSTYEWKSHKESATAPPACSSHTMTAVGQYGIYTFGGEGRRLSNWVFSLDPDTFRWSPVNTLGAPPPARQGHTAVWDGADSLIIFGGNNGDKIFSDVRLLSLSTGFWSEGKCSGPPPSPRHSHTAAMLDVNLMLVWGGCGPKGAVLNDAFLLNTTTFRWHKLESIGSPPMGRFCHSCGVVGQQVLMFGGTSAVQFFDSLISVSIDMGDQLNSLAESLANLSHNTEDSISGEMVKMQLGNHLRQRHARDVSQVAVTRAEISHRLFEDERKRSQALQAEVERLKLVVNELESRCHEDAQKHAAAVQALQHDRAAERSRANELNSQLQNALETIGRQDGGAAIVDGYKTMFKRMAAERDALADRNVDIEYENQTLRKQLTAVPLKDSNSWEEEHRP